jgi:hypothetical protein
MKHLPSQELLEAISNDVVADRLFFENNPHRKHRLRRAFPSESLMKLSEHLAPGRSWFVVVRQVKPGVRLRLPPFDSWADRPTDVDEESARAVFEQQARTRNGKKFMKAAGRLVEVLS